MQRFEHVYILRDRAIVSSTSRIEQTSKSHSIREEKEQVAKDSFSLVFCQAEKMDCCCVIMSRVRHLCSVHSLQERTGRQREMMIAERLVLDVCRT